MSRVFLILYQETLGEYSSEHGAAVGASTADAAIVTLWGSYVATAIRLRIHSVTEWEPNLSTKVVPDRLRHISARWAV